MSEGISYQYHEARNFDWSLLKWHKTQRGLVGVPKENKSKWYFISKNATYWCSSDINGNGQLTGRRYEDRLEMGKKLAEEHYRINFNKKKFALNNMEKIAKTAGIKWF